MSPVDGVSRRLPRLVSGLPLLQSVASIRNRAALRERAVISVTGEAKIATTSSRLSEESTETSYSYASLAAAGIAASPLDKTARQAIAFNLEMIIVLNKAA